MCRGSHSKSLLLFEFFIKGLMLKILETAQSPNSPFPFSFWIWLFRFGAWTLDWDLDSDLSLMVLVVLFLIFYNKKNVIVFALKQQFYSFTTLGPLSFLPRLNDGE